MWIHPAGTEVNMEWLTQPLKWTPYFLSQVAKSHAHSLRGGDGHQQALIACSAHSTSHLTQGFVLLWNLQTNILYSRNFESYWTPAEIPLCNRHNPSCQKQIGSDGTSTEQKPKLQRTWMIITWSHVEMIPVKLVHTAGSDSNCSTVRWTFDGDFVSMLKFSRSQLILM